MVDHRGLLWLVALAPAYGLRIAFSVGDIVARLLQAALLLLTGYLVLYFYSPRYELPRLMALYVLWDGLLFVLAWRLVNAWYFSREAFAKRVLVVGGGAAGVTALRLLRDVDFRNSTVLGLFDARGEHGEASLAAQARDLGVNEIILAHSGAQLDLLPALMECQERGVEVLTLPHAYEDVLRKVPVQHLEASWLFTSFVESVRAKDASLAAKRALDIVGGVVGVAILAVLTPIIALLIWLDSGRPIFFRQTRTGRGGREFVMLKFRTMVRDAEKGTGPQWSAAGDPRITRVGRVLRRIRFDELPNLLSVLRGDMSLVGPRPERPELVRVLEGQVPFYRTRLIARPGLTGWAQVNHPYGDSVQDASDKLEYDLYYLKHRSLLFDLRILLRTVATVLRFEGR
jgi:exopolysaccharide biosynthesis polyprenyl glycosylphosphotransferase